MSNDHPPGRYVPALAFGGTASPEQRQRNMRLYHRLRDGDGAGDLRRRSLAEFEFEVPLDEIRISPTAVTFQLAREGQCFGRLLGAISDLFDFTCDADDDLKDARERLDEERGMRIDLQAVVLALADHVPADVLDTLTAMVRPGCALHVATVVEQLRTSLNPRTP